MKRCPKVGSRVRYPGGPTIGPCVGVVVRIFVKHDFNEDRSDAWNAMNAKALPEDQWHVAMKPDVLPEKWCYTGNDKFAPMVADLTAV